VSEAILEVEAVEKRFGGIRAVDGASFGIERGSITALIGPNGAGKSTLFDIVSGFERAGGGAIRLDGRSIYRKPAYAIARLGLVRTFQLTKTLSVMSVLDNMLLAAQSHPGERLGGSLVRPFAARRREREVRTRALELLETFNLSGHASDYAGTLSGGQRKLLELARAIMLAPRLVLLDEPLAGVNPTLGRRLLEHIEEMRTRDGTTVLFVEHDMEVVMNHSDRVIVMAQGRVIAEGSAEEVRRNETVVEAYLGKLVVE
jgi:branched-chain amino acid transport system ATP-binding protein